MKAHLAHQSVLPCANKYLQFKWDKASYDIHRDKVKSAKSELNITAPKTYCHLVQQLKKQQLVGEWKQKVQSENDILQEKIFHIMNSSGGVDDRNYYEKKSLGKERKHQELLRITKENQKMLDHLVYCKPNYNVRNLHKDWHKHVKLMESITRYPGGWTNQTEGQEKTMKKPSGYDKDQKISADVTTQSLANNKAMGKAKSLGQKKAGHDKEKYPRAVMHLDKTANPVLEQDVSEQLQQCHSYYGNILPT